MMDRLMGSLRVMVLVLLVAGGALAPLWKGRGMDAGAWVYLGMAAAALAVGPVRRGCEGAVRWVGGLRPGVACVGLFVASAAYLAADGLRFEKYLGPKSQDEHSYVLGAEMLASGRLWARTDAGGSVPIVGASPESFESFHLITHPVYASIYAPGTALLYVPGVWLGAGEGGAWVTALVLSAACVPAAFLLLRELLEGVPALSASAEFARGTAASAHGAREESGVAAAGALLVLGGTQFRAVSLSAMSQVPSLLFVTLAFASGLRWWRGPSGRWAGLTGALLGWLIAIRPQDGAWVGVGLAVMAIGRAMAARGVGSSGAGASASPEQRASGGAVLRTLMWAGLGVAPFLVLLVAQNVGTTGSPFRTPYWEYTKVSQPGTGFLTVAAAGEPRTAVQQKVDYSNTMLLVARERLKQGFLRDAIETRLPETLGAALPLRATVALLPLGVVGLLASRRRAPGAWIPGVAALVALAGFAGVYYTFTFFLPQYGIPPTSLILAVALAAPAGVERILGGQPGGRISAAAMPLLCVASLLGALPETNPGVSGARYEMRELPHIDDVERTLTTRPALMLVRYHTPTLSDPPWFHEEPVYNLADWRVGANDVIRAHDLGPETNERLVRALAAEERSRDNGSPRPRRYVYLYDRLAGRAFPLGWADEIGSPAREIGKP